jgi:phosphinothricin acetyltransferase
MINIGLYQNIANYYSYAKNIQPPEWVAFLINMENSFLIREVTVADAADIYNVYKPYVDNTAISFEAVTPSVEEIEYKIKKITEMYPWLVCEHQGKVVGYAYGSTHRERPAYKWSVESSIYVDEAFHGAGIARILYETVFAILKLQGYCSVYAGVLSSNEKSCRFHEAIGFSEIGIFKHIGYKLGKWHSNKWYQLFLDESDTAPNAVRPTTEIKASAAYAEFLASANRKLKQLNVNSLF